MAGRLAPPEWGLRFAGAAGQSADGVLRGIDRVAVARRGAMAAMRRA